MTVRTCRYLKPFMVNIRRASLSDAADISILHTGSFHRGWSEADVQELLQGPGRIAFIMTVDKQAAGFLMAQSVCDEAEIVSLAVASQFRRRGFGTRLLAALEADLLMGECLSISLEVDEANAGAIKLYHRHGFRQVGFRKEYYISLCGQRTNALILMKNVHADDQ